LCPHHFCVDAWRGDRQDALARAKEAAMTRWTLLSVLALVAISSRASAECCRVIKTDNESPPSNVRICEPAPAQSCGAELFAGTLALGQSHEVCATGDTLVYQELDPATGAYGDPVVARCDGSDVEL
jgi:hypothetical protein